MPRIVAAPEVDVILVVALPFSNGQQKPACRRVDPSSLPQRRAVTARAQQESSASSAILRGLHPHRKKL
jgi:hypothetical protein